MVRGRLPPERPHDFLLYMGVRTIARISCSFGPCSQARSSVTVAATNLQNPSNLTQMNLTGFCFRQFCMSHYGTAHVRLKNEGPTASKSGSLGDQRSAAREEYYRLQKILGSFRT